MAGDDVTIAGGGDERKGYNTAVDEFCAQADGQVVPADGYLSLATEVFVNGGKDPTKYGLLGYVYCKLFRLLSARRGIIYSQPTNKLVEVHNKQSSDHTVEGKFSFAFGCGRIMLLTSFRRVMPGVSQEALGGRPGLPWRYQRGHKRWYLASGRRRRFVPRAG